MASIENTAFFITVLQVPTNYQPGVSVSNYSVQPGVIQSVVKSVHVSNVVIPGLTRNPVDKPSLYTGPDLPVKVQRYQFESCRSYRKSVASVPESQQYGCDGRPVALTYNALLLQANAGLSWLALSTSRSRYHQGCGWLRFPRSELRLKCKQYAGILITTRQIYLDILN